MKSNLTYLLASSVAGMIALAIVFATFPGVDDWSDMASQSVCPFTPDEARQLAGKYQRQAPDSGAQLSVTAASDLLASIEAGTVPDNGNPVRGQVELGNGRATMDQLPCQLHIFRRGWRELNVIDNGYCGGPGVNLSGRYERQPASP